MGRRRAKESVKQQSSVPGEGVYREKMKRKRFDEDLEMYTQLIIREKVNNQQGKVK